MTSTLTPPKAPTQPRPRRTSPIVRDEIRPLTAAVLAGSWIVLGAIAWAVEPVPDADVAIPAYVVVMAWTWLSLVVATGAGLMLRRRFGLAASLGAAVVFVASSIACPVSGHHAFGMWWIGQMFCTVGLVGVSAWALVREHGRAASA